MRIGETIAAMAALEPVTVLIVDDHPSFRAVAQVVLETDGFAVVGTASDGESGVAATLELAPDVVLLDVELPDIDGFEVAERLAPRGLAHGDRARVEPGRAPTSARSWPSRALAASSRRRISRGTRSVHSSHDAPAGYPRTSVTDLVVATPVFLDLTFVGLESLPVLGEERFAAELLRSPGGGAITAVGATRLGLDAAVAAPLGDDVGGRHRPGDARRGGRPSASRRGPRRGHRRRW